MIHTQIGSKEIPKFRLSTQLLGDIKILYDKFGLNANDLPTVARVLGHESDRSGTFLTKIASMRSYGLLDGRGKVFVTDIGEKIAFHPNDDVGFNDSLIKAVNRIPLWNALYEKYTKKGASIPTEDFWLDLKNLCDLTIEEAQKLAPEVRKAYEEDIKGIRAGLTQLQSMPQNMQTPIVTARTQSEAAPQDSTLIAWGDVKLFLPKEKTLESWKALKRMVDALLEAK